MKRILITAVALSLSLHISAQEVATQLAFGSANYLDTYLSPEKYRGFEGRFISEVLRYSGKRPLAYALTHEGAISTTHNRAGNANELCGSYDFTYSMMYRTAFCGGRLRLLAGGMAGYSIGFAYNMRNSANNPAQGYTSLVIGPHLMLRYDLTLWGRTFPVNWEARMPFVGVMFSPTTDSHTMRYSTAATMTTTSWSPRLPFRSSATTFPSTSRCQGDTPCA